MTSSFRPGFLYDVGLSRARCSDAAGSRLLSDAAAPSLSSSSSSSPDLPLSLGLFFLLLLLLLLFSRPGPALPLPPPSPLSLPPRRRRLTPPPSPRHHVRDHALQRRQSGPLWPRRRGGRPLLQLPPPGHQLLGEPVQAAPQTGTDREGQESGDRRR